MLAKPRVEVCSGLPVAQGSMAGAGSSWWWQREGRAGSARWIRRTLHGFKPSSNQQQPTKNTTSHNIHDNNQQGRKEVMQDLPA